MLRGGFGRAALPVAGTPQPRATGGLVAFLADEKYSLRMLYLALALACIGLALGWRVPDWKPNWEKLPEEAQIPG